MHIGSLFIPLGGNCLTSTIGIFTGLLEFFLSIIFVTSSLNCEKSCVFILCDLALICLKGDDATDLSELAFEAKSFKDDAW